MGISLYRGPTGEPGGEVHLPGTSRASKRWLWKWVSLSVGALRGEPEGMAPLLETPKDM